MGFTLTAILGIDTSFEFGSAQQPIRFRHRPLALDPCGLKGVEPWTVAGQPADHEPHPDRAPLDLLMVRADPAPHRLTARPGGVIPAQQQRGEAWGCPWSRAPRQTRDGDGTHGTPCDKPEPPLGPRLRPWPHQQSITGQGLGSGSSRRGGPLWPRGRGLGVRPARVVGLGQPTPPACSAQAQRP